MNVIGMSLFACIADVSIYTAESLLYLYRHPLAMLGTDGLYAGGGHIAHPRAFASFPRYGHGFELPDSKYGIDALREFWSNVYRVNMYYFKTLFGDLYIEFGLIGSFIVGLLTVAAGWFAKTIKNPLLCHFLLYYYARVIVLWGIFGYGLLQDVVVDLTYAIVFWIILSKYWNPRKKEDDADAEAEESESEER